MKTETTIKILGKKVLMRYCAASETGYEQISGKSSEIFLPKKVDGVAIPSAAKLEDFLSLAVASIIAAYSYRDEEPPVTSKEIMYDCKPEEITLLVKTVGQLRIQWYTIPKTAPKPTETQQEDSQKNV